jgi:hypothetical protein
MVCLCAHAGFAATTPTTPSQSQPSSTTTMSSDSKGNSPVLNSDKKNLSKIRIITPTSKTNWSKIKGLFQ